MKRALIIGTGAVCSLGAVLLITPPQIGSSGSLLNSGSGSTTGLLGSTSSSSAGSTGSSTAATSGSTSSTAGSAATGTTAPTTTKKNTTKKSTTKKSTTKKSTTKNSGSSSTSSSSTSSSSGSTPSSTTSSTAGISGTFDGAVAQTIYGPVQVQVTITNGKITAAKALTYPTSSFRDQQINSQAIPWLAQETIQAQSASIQGVGGASYTTQGWIASLQSALAKAGF